MFTFAPALPNEKRINIAQAQIESKIGIPPRTRYHAAAEKYPEKYATSRKAMVDHYAAEVSEMYEQQQQDCVVMTRLTSGANPSRSRFSDAPPDHPSAVSHPRYSTSTPELQMSPLDIRVLQWNVNILTGHDSRTPIAASDIMAIVKRSNADVVLLQEAADQQNFMPRFPWADPEGLCGERATKARMGQLRDMLRAEGYTLLTSPCENPALVATRLPVSDPGVVTIIDGQFQKQMTSEGENRSGRLVQLSLGRNGLSTDAPERTFGVFVTHLHHTEGSGKSGLRLEETRMLLSQMSRARSSKSTQLSATLLATDMNAPRGSDYAPREWNTIAGQLRRLGEPVADGVAPFLEERGFQCCYDLAPKPAQFGIFKAPTFTHWTCTTVDFAWLRAEQPDVWGVKGVYVLPTNKPLSDHLPVITDLVYRGD